MSIVSPLGDSSDKVARYSINFEIEFVPPTTSLVVVVVVVRVREASASLSATEEGLPSERNHLTRFSC